VGGGSDVTTRVLLGDLPSAFGEVVKNAVRYESDLVVIGEAMSEIDLLLDSRNADVVVLVADGSESGLAVVERLLDAHLDIAVLAVNWTAQRAWLYRQQATRERLPDQSLADFAGAIRWAAATAAGRCTPLDVKTGEPQP
jgi:hypothetical protein